MKIIAYVAPWIGKTIDCGRCGCQSVIEKSDAKSILKQIVRRANKFLGVDYSIKCPSCGEQNWLGRKLHKKEQPHKDKLKPHSK